MPTIWILAAIILFPFGLACTQRAFAHGSNLLFGFGLAAVAAAGAAISTAEKYFSGAC